MINTLGHTVTLTLFGESHGAQIGCVLDGLSAGIPVCEETVKKALALRRPAGNISTARREEDEFSIVSGVYRGYTTGAPLTVLIPNKDTRSGDYDSIPLRPGHADLTALQKYKGFSDPRGGGHFSARLTAPIVAAGAIVREALKRKGIVIGTHLSSVGRVCDRGFENVEADLAFLADKAFPVLDGAAAEKMEAEILTAREDCDSVGGVLETAVTGLPAGLGGGTFRSVESVLSHALFSVPAVKGVEFGGGFGLSAMRGSEANDAIGLDERGEYYLKTNRCGGLLGGITCGAPLLFRCAMKPTPTIAKPQETVLASEGREVIHSFHGRHDPCVAHRAAAVVNAVTALVLADLLAQHYGEGWLGEEK